MFYVRVYDLIQTPQLTPQQAQRNGGHSGAVLPQMTVCAYPNKNCAPPKRGLCPEEINWLAAAGVEIEV